MKRFAVIGAVVVAVLVVIAAAVWLLDGDDRTVEERLDDALVELGVRDDDHLGGSGFLEGRAVTLSAESSGTVVDVPVSEGDAIVSGEVVAVIANDEILARVRQAGAAVEAAQAARDRLVEGASDDQLRAAEAAYAQAAALADAAERAWRQLDGASGAIGFDPSLNEALTAYEAATAARAAAQARLALLQAGPTDAERQAAEANVRRAVAALSASEAQLGALTVRAPTDGRVTDVFATPGESVPAGAPLARIARLDPLTLTVYVAASDLGEFDVGDEVEVEVDAFEDRTFEGRVEAIASEAEFAPRNVQTSEERASLVYAVSIVVPNTEGVLKPGMPADARIVSP